MLDLHPFVSYHLYGSFSPSQNVSLRDVKNHMYSQNKKRCTPLPPCAVQKQRVHCREEPERYKKKVRKTRGVQHYHLPLDTPHRPSPPASSPIPLPLPLRQKTPSPPPPHHNKTPPTQTLSVTSSPLTTTTLPLLSSPRRSIYHHYPFLPPLLPSFLPSLLPPSPPPSPLKPAYPPQPQGNSHFTLYPISPKRFPPH